MSSQKESSAELGARLTASLLAGECFASERVVAARRISMLHEATLWALQQCAQMSVGPAIELGPYIGGSTIALASGTTQGVISVEYGGPNPNHPQIPTLDSVTDLHRNLVTAGLRNRVTVIEGNALRSCVAQQVETALSGRRAGMLFIDIDPGTDIAIKLYSKWLADDAFLVIDDCVSEEAQDKSESVKAFIAAGLQAGAIEPIGLYPWGTWFGRLTGPGAATALAALPNGFPGLSMGDGTFSVFDAVPPCGAEGGGEVVLLEDGVPLGPHCGTRAEAAAHGNGAFNIGPKGTLYFTTADGSNPRRNGRTYTVVAGGITRNLAAAAWIE